MENIPITNDDVLGDAICYDEQEFLRQKCYSLFELSPSVCFLLMIHVISCWHMFFKFILSHWFSMSTFVRSWNVTFCDALIIFKLFSFNEDL